MSKTSKSNITQSLSNRGRIYAESSARLDLDLYQDVMQNQYHPQENPNGGFALNIAENAVSSAMIRDRIQKIYKHNELPDWVLKYTSHLGHIETRQNIAKIMRKYLGSPSIDENTIALSAGASASLEVISFVLGDKNDKVVTPAPAYPMYKNDLGVKSELQVHYLQTHYNIHDKETLPSLILSI